MQVVSPRQWPCLPLDFVSGVGVVGGHSRHRRLLSFGHRLPPTVYAAVDNEVVCQTHAYVGVMVAEHTIVGRRFESTLNERKVRPGWVDQSAWKLKCLTRRTYLGELYPFFAQWVIQRGGRGCFRHGVVCSGFETRTASLHSWLGAPYLHVDAAATRSVPSRKQKCIMHSTSSACHLGRGRRSPCNSGTTSRRGVALVVNVWLEEEEGGR